MIRPGKPPSWLRFAVRCFASAADVLGPFESLARTPLREVAGPYGAFKLAQPEELLVERVLVSIYPQAYAPARACAKVLAAVALKGGVQMDWNDVRRLAGLPDYGILEHRDALVREVANELKINTPFDPA